VQDTLARITERVAVPVIVDADTGFGNALNVQRTVRGLERAGAAMIQLEDQGFPKRCGHLDGKTVIPVAEMCGKLRAALDARHSADTLILARTDALAVEGWTPRWTVPSLPGLRRGRAVHRGAAHARSDGRACPLRRAHAAAGQHGRGRQDAGAGRGSWAGAAFAS
jgi:2-methylisocitrate lyase-like PEP mutase family enzyme